MEPPAVIPPEWKTSRKFLVERVHLSPDEARSMAGKAVEICVEWLEGRRHRYPRESK